MPRNKSKEEILQKAKLARRLRYAKIKSDPVLYALEKEKERQRYRRRKEEKKILSIKDMTPTAKRQQRKKWREHFKKHYHKKLQLKRGLAFINTNSPSCSEAEDLLIQEEREVGDIFHHLQEPSTSNNCNLDNQYKPLDNVSTPNSYDMANQLEKVKIKFRKLRYLFLRKDKMHMLQVELLQNKIQRFKKVIQRLKKRLQSPTTKVTNLLKDKTKIREAKKKILFGEAIKNSLEESFKGLQSNKDKKQFSDTIIKNKTVLKDSKVLSETRKFTVRNKKYAKKDDPYQKIKADIISFFERDDVSRITSGKKECITRDQDKKQKRYLLDTMKNLHRLFERQFTKVSYSYFCKQRPFWVLIPAVNDRDTCLCKIHANVDNLITALNKRKILKEKCSQDVIASLCCQKVGCLLNRCEVCKLNNLEYFINKDEDIRYGKWDHKIEKYKRGDVEKIKKIITKTIKLTTSKEAVIELEKTLPEFIKHEGTRRWQYSATRNLKCNLKNNEVVIHIDFSENYAFKYESEVQAFHFGGSRKELTLHTAVLYFAKTTGELTCQSFCTVSTNMRHDAAAVWAHIIPLLEFIKITNKNINTMHFISDSPSSQYRNKTMFYIISKLHWYLCDLMTVTWNYSEAGHGKGAADGVGGTVKRIADLAVANGKDIVSIEDFIQAVTQSTEKIILKIVDDYQIYEKDLLIPMKRLKALRGTLKVHQVLWQKGKCLVFRESSCFDCLDVTCNHTNFIGKLSYPEEETNKNMENLDVTALPHRVQPKSVFLRNNSTITSRMVQSVNNEKENLQITSNIMIKAPDTDYDKVTPLSAITPDNKLHLGLEVDIDNMMCMYNISTASTNFSGISESFVRAQTPPSDVKPCYNDVFNSDSEGDLIFRPKSSPLLRSKENRILQPRVGGVEKPKSFDAKSSGSLEYIPTSSKSRFKSIPKKVEIRNLSLSDDDDELDIFSRL